jgi:hypothetical protein
MRADYPHKNSIEKHSIEKSDYANKTPTRKTLNIFDSSLARKNKHEAFNAPKRNQ